MDVSEVNCVSILDVAWAVRAAEAGKPRPYPVPIIGDAQTGFFAAIGIGVSIRGPRIKRGFQQVSLIAELPFHHFARRKSD